MTTTKPKEYYLARYHRVMKFAIEILGGQCVVCLATENLQFDHVDPKTKLFTISSGWALKAEDFWLEVAKCQLLCQPCHASKTSTDGSLIGNQATIDPICGTMHGSLSGCKCGLCRNAKSLYRYGKIGYHELVLDDGGFTSGGTNRPNQKGNSRKNLDTTKMARGESHGRAKLRDLDIKYIFGLAELGYTHNAIAKEFSIERSSVSRILRGESWSHLRLAK